MVTLEGLGGETYGSPVFTMVSQINDKGYQRVRFAHAHTPATMAACVRRWLTNTPGGKMSILGHGFGGNTAWNLAYILGVQGIDVRNLVLFDARNGDGKGCGALGSTKIIKPTNVKYVFNYYQCGRLAGKQVVPGKGVYNYRLDVGHVQLPQAPMVRNFMTRVLNHDVVAFTSRSMIQFTKHFQFGPSLSEVGEIAQREALGLVRPADRSVRAPASIENGIRKTRCEQFGVTFDCPVSQADQFRRWLRASGS